MMDRNETTRLIAQTGVVPKKSKGQNFLIDERVAERHVNFADIRKDDRVLEVGPGLGILTNFLTQKSDHVTCIELDEALADYIEDTFPQVTLIRGDATKIDFPEFDKFVSNLPYSVSTPIIFKLLEYDFETAVVMVQKEFAERMIAPVGLPDYSRLTVNLYYRADCEIMEGVPASRFKPRPRVDSSLVKITPRKAPFEVLNEKTFFKVTEVTFNHRRKQIGTSLKAAGLIDADTEIPFRNDRVEILSPEEIGQLSDAVFKARN